MIIGHEKQIRFIEDILGSRNIPQAYLFVGPDKIGKFSMAKLFADSLNKGAKKINQKNLSNRFSNPDIDILEPEIIEKKGIIKMKKIEIDDVRNSQKNLSLYPLSGKFRVLLIDNAHALTIAAQNSILKTLEEPNETSIIILVTHEDGSILDTIKSRCQIVNFNLVSLENIKKGFKNEIDDKSLEKISIFSMGRPGEAKNMIGDKKEMMEKEGFIKDLNFISSSNISEKLNLAETYSKNIPRARLILEFWIWFIRIQAFRGIKDNNKTEKYYKLIEKIDKASSKLKNSSFNSRLILENLFIDL